VQVPALLQVQYRSRGSARLYITHRRLVEINGTRAIDVELAPGWTISANASRYRRSMSGSCAG
jgi:hypothetical protein